MRPLGDAGRARSFAPRYAHPGRCCFLVKRERVARRGDAADGGVPEVLGLLCELTLAAGSQALAAREADAAGQRERGRS